ncbi:MAG: ABC transporter permease [Richelia sp. RM2_1_2]|nr:ABC transporter permease [Richelia sp. SM1_7_0]NJN10921.1 ABC transporter permease [Richelia sp. RM1_1_1]NJO30034.1 ABC transporter permease [Richelia sp. SL_2_1]NJO61420.1 ABC transporter permease [Richelia sp. RM2_1_2]
MNLGQKRRHKTVYTPDSRIIRPVYLFKEMIADLLASRELAWRLLVRNIRGQYRQSFLGITWAIVPPALTAAGLSFANNTGILNVGQTDIPYPAYVMLGTVLWQTFLESFNSPQVAIKASRPLLAQVKFPHEAIILTQLGETLFNLVIKLLLVVVLFIVFRVSVSWTIILSPIAIINLMMLGTAIGLLLVPITNLVQDVSRSLEVITLAWFFLTPIAYPIPDNKILNFIVELNPVTPLLVTAREMITTGILSQTFSFVLVSVITWIGLILGWLVYRLAMPYLIERIS